MKGHFDWQGATLKKLPMWGDEDMEVNFEWPTEEEWTLMNPNIQMT